MIVRTRADKEDAAPTHKRTYGHHPLVAMLAETGEVLAGMFRPGNAGANCAADHVVTLAAAIDQLPEEWQEECRVRNIGFDTLVGCGPGTTRTWAGRSRRRWSGVPSYSASTWPPSAGRPPRSSPIARRRHQGLEPDAAGTPAAARGVWAAAGWLSRSSTNPLRRSWMRSLPPAC
jgi:hypothetical protein